MITVIIPTYRRPHLLRRAIDSVLAQTYPHFLICVYDNASNDGTEEILREYAQRDKRVQYHIQTENLGSNRNWQSGFDAVETPFFTVLSDDDLFMPTFLEEAMRSFAAHPDAGIFIGGIIFIDEKQRIRAFNFYEGAECAFYEPLAFATLLMNNKLQPYNWAGMLFRREVQKKCGQLRLELLCVDTEFLLRAYKEFSVVISRVPCSIFVVHRSNISLGCSPEDFVALQPAFMHFLTHFFEDKEMIERALNRSFAHNMIQLCCQKFAGSNFQGCLEGTELLMEKKLLPVSGKILKILSKACLKYSFLNKMFQFCCLLRRVALSLRNERRLKNHISEQCFASFLQLRR